MSDSTNLTGAAIAATVVPKQAEAATAEAAPAAKGPSAEEAFARREKQFRAQQAKFQQEKQAYEAKLKGYETDYVPKSRIKENAWEVLSESGVSEQDLITAMQTTPNDPVSKALFAKVRAMEAKLAAAEQASTQQQQQAFEDTKKAMTIEIKQAVAANAEYETIAATPGADEAVLELILADFEQTGELKDVDAACLEVENYLLEQAAKYAGLKKVQAKLTPQAPASTPTVPKQSQTVSTKLRTLTNEIPTETNNRKSTWAEKRQRAIDIIEGRIKA